jgi:transposase
VSLSSIEWASYRTNKAAIKVHTRIDADAFLPTFMIVDKGKPHDDKYAVDLCKTLSKGEILIFDRAYNDYRFLYELTERKVNWVGRLKKGAKYEITKTHELTDKQKKEGIKADCEIVLTNSHEKYPIKMRMIKAEVKVRNKKKVLHFFSNQMTWAASSICELYRSRWIIEEFFKELKQTLQLKSFYGENKNAIIWQIYSALLVYLLTRYLAHVHKWSGGIPRLFAIFKSTLFKNINLERLIKSYGTAKDKNEGPDGLPPPQGLSDLPLFAQSYGTANKDMSKLPV